LDGSPADGAADPLSLDDGLGSADEEGADEEGAVDGSPLLLLQAVNITDISITRETPIIEIRLDLFGMIRFSPSELDHQYHKHHVVISLTLHHALRPRYPPEFDMET